MVSLFRRNEKYDVIWDQVNDVLCKLKTYHRYDGKDIEIIEVVKDFAEIEGKKIKFLRNMSDDDVTFTIIESGKDKIKAIMKAPPNSIGVAIVENDNTARFIVVYTNQYSGAKHKIFA